MKIEVNMKWFAIVIVLQTASKLVGSFDLPKPLDNFYEEVVRFYKRLRTEGGNVTNVTCNSTPECVLVFLYKYS